MNALEILALRDRVVNIMYNQNLDLVGATHQQLIRINKMLIIFTIVLCLEK